MIQCLIYCASTNAGHSFIYSQPAFERSQCVICWIQATSSFGAQIHSTYSEYTFLFSSGCIDECYHRFDFRAVPSWRTISRNIFVYLKSKNKLHNNNINILFNVGRRTRKARRLRVDTNNQTKQMGASLNTRFCINLWVAIIVFFSQIRSLGIWIIVTRRHR